jgi:hypothetical protein
MSCEAIAKVLYLDDDTIRYHCRPVEGGGWAELGLPRNELVSILFGVDLNRVCDSAVVFPIFSDRERCRELWPNTVFTSHGFHSLDEF